MAPLRIANLAPSSLGTFSVIGDGKGIVAPPIGKFEFTQHTANSIMVQFGGYSIVISDEVFRALLLKLPQAEHGLHVLQGAQIVAGKKVTFVQ